MRVRSVRCESEEWAEKSRESECGRKGGEEYLGTGPNGATCTPARRLALFYGVFLQSLATTALKFLCRHGPCGVAYQSMLFCAVAYTKACC